MTDCQSKVVIFTDLDGTLLDLVTYSYDKALPAIEYLRERSVPLIFCSSKTRAEQEFYRQQLGIQDPFIVGNGGAIFIPQGYFSFDFPHNKVEYDYQIIELWIPYREIRQILQQVRNEVGIDFRGFGDMSTREVAAETGLDQEAAKRAKAREYDETLKIQGSPEEIHKVLDAIKKSGLNYTVGGRFYTAMGPSDKGKATRILADLFRKKLGQIETVGIGDSPNDLPMLMTVDIPVLVQKPGGDWGKIDAPHLYRVEGAGPEGWSRAIEEIVKHRLEVP